MDDIADENALLAARSHIDDDMARRIFAKGRLRFQRQMLDMDDWPAGGTPPREEIDNALLRLGVVPRSPARIVKALLHVDEKQCVAG
jgi:hypothetical protein